MTNMRTVNPYDLCLSALISPGNLHKPALSMTAWDDEPRLIMTSTPLLDDMPSDRAAVRDSFMGPDDDDDDGDFRRGPGTGLITKTRPKTQRPAMYKVLMLNDDYTPMEFVVVVLQKFFHKDRDAATQIMLQIHREGVGVCGVFTYEVAETKVNQVMDFARQHEHPLQCTLEES